MEGQAGLYSADLINHPTNVIQWIICLTFIATDTDSCAPTQIQNL